MCEKIKLSFDACYGKVVPFEKSNHIILSTPFSYPELFLVL
jgi:hypothetical protein